jgi:hypothetical protein
MGMGDNSGHNDKAAEHTYQSIKQLINSMERSPWEANSISASLLKKFPGFFYVTQ